MSRKNLSPEFDPSPTCTNGGGGGAYNPGYIGGHQEALTLLFVAAGDLCWGGSVS